MDFKICMPKSIFLIQHISNNTQINPKYLESENVNKQINTNENLKPKNNSNINMSFNDDKTCGYCKKTFASKYDMERHVRYSHEKLYLKKCKYCFKSFNYILSHMKNCKKKNSKIEALSANSPLLNKKRKNNAENLINKDNSENAQKKSDIFIIHENKEKSPVASEKKNFSKSIVISKNVSINITNKKNKIQNDSLVSSNSHNESLDDWEHNANKIDLYKILKDNEYIPLKNYFFFKNLVLGKGKYGTVWFSIDSNNSMPVAIKSANNLELQQSFESEVIIMKSIEKYGIFSKVYDQFNFLGRRYLVETLQGPALNKILNFCSGKLSINSIYKIGIELITCFKYFHEAGFIYLDLKADNIAILFNEKFLNNEKINITLLDCGFGVAYLDQNGNHKDLNNSEKKHGNIYLSSINALSNKPISRRDDMISLVYFLFDIYLQGLPWENLGKSKKDLNKIINLKKNFSPENFSGNSIKELVILYNEVINLGFYEKPNYNKYVDLLNSKLIRNKKKNKENFIFDWEKKLLKIINSGGDIKTIIKNNSLIRNLFDGYPEEIITNYLNKYLNKNKNN